MVITVLLALLVGASLDFLPTADGATTFHYTAPQWEHFAVHPQALDTVTNSSIFNTVPEQRTDLADAFDANPTWCVTAAGRITTADKLNDIATADELNGAVPGTFPRQGDEPKVDRFVFESALPVGSTEPANRDDVALALMLLFDTVATSDLRPLYEVRRRVRRARRRRPWKIVGRTHQPGVTTVYTPSLRRIRKKPDRAVADGRRLFVASDRAIADGRRPSVASGVAMQQLLRCQTRFDEIGAQLSEANRRMTIGGFQTPIEMGRIADDLAAVCGEPQDNHHQRG